MKILIDNGHGENTAGKCSPDGKFREYRYARDIAERVVAALRSRGYDAERIVTEEKDIPLSVRCQRVNQVCDQIGSKNVLLVSIHNNAAGNGGEWMYGTGFEAWTYYGQSKSDQLAEHIYDAAQKYMKGQRMRTDTSDNDRDKEGSLYILKHTKCAAVLTENLFMDNKKDVAYLNSEEGQKAVVATHVEGIISYINSL